MAVSAWWVWRQAGWNRGRSALILFFVQLVLNVLWPALFFWLRRPGLALAEIILLLASIVATAFAFARISEIALYLLLPYIAWVSFATALNLRIWQLNRGGILDAYPESTASA
jgi:tryptophan-rich sensory protein